MEVLIGRIALSCTTMRNKRNEISHFMTRKYIHRDEKTHRLTLHPDKPVIHETGLSGCMCSLCAFSHLDI